MFNWLKKRKEERERMERERIEQERISHKEFLKRIDECSQMIEDMIESRNGYIGVAAMAKESERRRKEKEKLWKEVMGESNTNSEKMKNGLTVETSEESGERIYRIF